MPDYTEFLHYFVKLEKICIEKNWDNKTIIGLKQWLLCILKFYEPSWDILNHFSLNEYIEYNLEKLKQTKDIKLLELNEILVNSQSYLYKCIQKIPFHVNELIQRFSKEENSFVLDENGDYYLSASGVCHRGETIELLDEPSSFLTLQHELQHINQNYIYPSEFPFANDMLQMLNEGEGEYHYHLLDITKDFYPIEGKDSYYIYYLVYMLLMSVLPKEMRDSWNKLHSVSNFHIFSDLFKDITKEENRNNFSDIFSLATLIVASCNCENTKEIFNNSVDVSINRCSKKVEKWDLTISYMLKEDRKKFLEGLQSHIESVNEKINLVQNPNLLMEKYMEIISEEKEFIASEPKEVQQQLFDELELFTFEKFETILKGEIKEEEKSLREYQDKKERTPQEILGEDDYKRYQYYRFGMELSQKMQVLLTQELSFTELFEQFLEKIESYLIEKNAYGLDEKLSMIDKIRNNSLRNSKKI